MKNVHNKATIEAEITGLLNRKGFMPIDIPVVRINEGKSLDMFAETFKSPYDLAVMVDHALTEPDYTRSMVMFDSEEELLYVMFTTHNDTQLPEFLTAVALGNA